MAMCLLVSELDSKRTPTSVVDHPPRHRHGLSTIRRRVRAQRLIGDHVNGYAGYRQFMFRGSVPKWWWRYLRN